MVIGVAPPDGSGSSPGVSGSPFAARCRDTRAFFVMENAIRSGLVCYGAWFTRRPGNFGHVSYVN
jgi:hypothetical protein